MTAYFPQTLRFQNIEGIKQRLAKNISPSAVERA
jgi:hypothetical protein